jgi:hypothetical protein
LGNSPIPDDVLAFIDRAVTSIDQLEILLLLRANPDRVWSADAVSFELRSNPQAAEERLQLLQAAGLLQRASGSDPGYRYAPGSPTIDDLVTRLGDCYRDYRLRVIERVFKKPDGLQSFAEAFRFKKDGS